MNKLTKKVVSLLTILAFLLTMAPVAAFADDPAAEEPKVTLTFDKQLAKDDTATTVTMAASAENFAEVAESDKVVAKLFVNDVEKLTVDNATVKAAAAEDADHKLTFDGIDPALKIGDKVTVKLLEPKTDPSSNIEEVLFGEVSDTVPPVDGDFAPNSDGSTAVLSDATEEDAVELDTAEETEFKLEFNKAYKGAIYIWAEKDANQPHEKFTVVRGEDGKETKIAPADIKNFDNIYYVENIETDAQGNGVFFDVKFDQTGTYRVYASTVDPRNKNEADGTVIIGENFFKKKFRNTPPRLEAVKNQNKAIVSDEYVDVEGMLIESVNSPHWVDPVECGGIAGLAYEQNDEDQKEKDPCCENNEVDSYEIEDWVLVDPNDTTKSKVKATLFRNLNDKVPIGKGHEVTVSVNHPGIKVNNEAEVKLTTDKNGTVEFSVTGNVEGEYFVYVEGRNCSVRVPVKVTPLRANTIEKVDSPENPIAAGDVRNANYFSFRVLDIDGNVLKQPFKEESPILGMDGLRNQFKALNKLDERLRGPVYGWNEDKKKYDRYDGDFFRILKQPAKAKLKEKNVTISSDVDEDLFFVNFNKDLVVGDYAFEVRLDNGQKAVFEFTVKEFGKATKLEISYPTKYVELGYSSDAATVKFIDENGVEKDAKKYVSLGANGYALKAFNQYNGKVTVKNDEKYLGDVITVTAIAPREGLVADTTLTVTDGKGGNETLTFDKKSGPVNKVHRVKVQVVDSKGNEIALGNDKVIQSMDVVVGEKSNKDATVTAHIDSASKSSLQEDGTAELILKSDKPTTADLKVTIVAQANKKGAIHTAFYRGTLHYEFTDKAEFAGRNLVMTINSKDVIVDGKIVKIDAAPIIKENRTFVPYRALAEAFGAKVDWDGEKRTVTAEMDGKKVVMTIDEVEYTDNGEEAKMDVAPFIQGDRTMIPIRFAAQALGFKVTPTYNADGTTASVVFNK